MPLKGEDKPDIIFRDSMRRRDKDSRQVSLSYTVISRSIGIVVFLILLVILNILLRQIQSPFFHAIVGFLNVNFWVILLFGLLFLFADVFRAAFFPLNLPYPLIAGIGSVFFLMFFFRLMDFLDAYFQLAISGYIDWTYYFIAPLVFLIVLVCGYVSIFRKAFCPVDGKGITGATPVGIPVEEEKSGIVAPVGPTRVIPEESKSWDDISAEFRALVFDIIHAFRAALLKK